MLCALKVILQEKLITYDGHHRDLRATKPLPPVCNETHAFMQYGHARIFATKCWLLYAQSDDAKTDKSGYE